MAIRNQEALLKMTLKSVLQYDIQLRLRLISELLPSSMYIYLEGFDCLVSKFWAQVSSLEKIKPWEDPPSQSKITILHRKFANPFSTELTRIGEVSRQNGWTSLQWAQHPRKRRGQVVIGSPTCWEVSEGITKQGRFEITVSMYLSMRPHSVLHEKCRRLKAHHRIFLRNKSHPVVEDSQLGEGTDHLPSAGGKKAADHRPPWSCS